MILPPSTKPTKMVREMEFFLYMKNLILSIEFQLFQLFFSFMAFKAFVANFPARTCIQVAKLPLNALVEIDAIAAVGEVIIT